MGLACLGVPCISMRSVISECVCTSAIVPSVTLIVLRSHLVRLGSVTLYRTFRAPPPLLGTKQTNWVAILGVVLFPFCSATSASLKYTISAIPVAMYTYVRACVYKIENKVREPITNFESVTNLEWMTSLYTIKGACRKDNVLFVLAFDMTLFHASEM